MKNKYMRGQKIIKPYANGTYEGYSWICANCGREFFKQGKAMTCIHIDVPWQIKREAKK